MPAKVADSLMALINLLKNAENLQDINNFNIYYLHPLKGKRKGEYALDIAGRKAGYRLIIVPLDDDDKKKMDDDINRLYKTTNIIMTLEVSNHYE